MRQTDLKSTESYDRIVLSPHFDDAALSLGGAIAAWSESGERVLVITVCAGVPAADHKLTKLAHGFSGDDARAYVLERRREDVVAMDQLGADYFWNEATDAIYRMPAQYGDLAALFGGEPHALDPLRRELARMAQALDGCRVYAPLGLGGHVDHVLAAQFSAATFAYEDIPYVFMPGVLTPGDFTLQDVTKTLERKLSAVRVYETQAKVLGGDDLLHRIARHAKERGLEATLDAAERLYPL
jgi:LmbE family N-acetylglucosaminyl deacetylase